MIQRGFGLYRRVFIAVFCLSFSSGQAFADSALENVTIRSEQTSDITKAFTPRPTSNLAIDYNRLTGVLGEAVLYMGHSTRNRAARRKRTGTRMPDRIDTKYRMEGNKVLYPYFSAEISRNIVILNREMLSIAQQVDITTLSRDQQLAFWINLHNLRVIGEIDAHYPGPARNIFGIKPLERSKADLHSAQLFHINGVPLSLRDIREKIVLAHWNVPDIAFAFHLGHMSGPSMRHRAYEAARVQEQIRDNAEEFVNALRGYENGRINPYFKEVAPHVFPDFERDIRHYFTKRMWPETLAEFNEHGIKRTHRLDRAPADITHGKGQTFTQEMRATTTLFQAAPAYDGPRSSGMILNPYVDQFIRERDSKLETLRRQSEARKGTVIIVDETQPPQE